MTQEEKYLQKFDYKFPENLIAQKPASPRDSARLLVYNRKTKKIHYDRFTNIVKYLPQNSVLVFNQTKVIPARLNVKKETGGLARILFVKNADPNLIFLSDRPLKINSKVSINKNIHFKVAKIIAGQYHLKPSFKPSKIHQILKKYGQTPIPPYIKNSPLKEKDLKQKYQTVFAKNLGSVAAPTASLHFTKKLIGKIKKSGVGVAFITLHVNLGTFATVTAENLQTSRLHKEFFEIDVKIAKILSQAKKDGKKIIPVGTTSLRTLESATNQKGEIKKLKGETDLFIRDQYHFKFTDGLITNFHVPRSSLLMLVSALVGREKILEIYQKAIQKKFRLFSFGDGMLIV
ncbi:MAG: tRNA preQ1(34) S-adenosylmethionine ribosyltransferase-isomerase QueA [Patescibacteria group bacterium]